LLPILCNLSGGATTRARTRKAANIRAILDIPHPRRNRSRDSGAELIRSMRRLRRRYRKHQHPIRIFLFEKIFQIK
jgi:hypothetical protein